MTRCRSCGAAIEFARTVNDRAIPLDAEHEGEFQPPLVATGVTYCVTHGATDHDGRKWTACRFRQLFYFENPMDEDTLLWSDEMGDAVTVDVGYAHTLTERGGPCREDCPHPSHLDRQVPSDG